MDKKVGDALSDEDLRGPPPPDERPASPPPEGEDGGAGRLTMAELEAAKALPRPRRKAPTDCRNVVYLQAAFVHLA